MAAVPAEVLAQLARDARYAPYLERQASEIEQLRRDEGIVLAEGLDYATMPGLSRELQEKLARVRPETLAQAGRIEGMTPAALTLLLMRSRQAQALRRAS
jgi:tRNA uridine 5-carboxymethylaminomethyl modification enzyme